ncbi:MAG: TRAP transporter substrate-binding protein [Candidatus Limnocylindrales bacterium]
MRTGTFGPAAAMAGVILAAAACSVAGAPAAAPSGASPSSPAQVAAQDPPVTLRLAVAGASGGSPETEARDFVERVTALSDGNVTIEPTFDAGAGTSAGFELGVAESLKAGDADLAMTGSRVWDLVGVTSLQALQAPFLIDTDDLALEVAKSDIATRALGGMAEAGITGLAIWPEELRHLFSFPNCDKDYRTPEGIAGAQIGITPSQVSRDVVAALGGIDSAFETGNGDAEACRLQGVERGLTGVGVPLGSAVATSNVVLFPKYQVLVANLGTLGRLSAGQQAVVRQAAAETQVDAYARQPNEVKLASAWCLGGGTVQLASADQLEALKAATAPVTAALEQDPLTKQLIADIRALKATLDLPVSDVTCDPSGTSGPKPSVPPQDTTGFLATQIPDGTYRTEITEADLIAKGASPTFAAANAGVRTWTFQDLTYLQEQVDPCQGTYTISIGSHLTFHGCDVDGGSFMWRPDGDGIRILQLLGPDLSAKDRIEIGAYFDRVMTKID